MKGVHGKCKLEPMRVVLSAKSVARIFSAKIRASCAPRRPKCQARISLRCSRFPRSSKRLLTGLFVSFTRQLEHGCTGFGLAIDLNTPVFTWSDAPRVTVPQSRHSPLNGSDVLEMRCSLFTTRSVFLVARGLRILPYFAGQDSRRTGRESSRSHTHIAEQSDFWCAGWFVNSCETAECSSFMVFRRVEYPAS
jgi:hypothetical protein